MIQLLVLAIAMLIGLASTRLMKLIHLPNVTGYLIAGILIGPYVLGLAFSSLSFNGEPLKSLIYDNQVMSYISNVALGFIAFSIGASFKFSSLKAVGSKIVLITVFEALGASIFVILGLFLTKIFISDIPVEIILTLGAISCATAPAATLMVIKQYKAKGPVVSTLLPVVAFDDAVALIVFEVLFSIAKAMAKGTTPNFLSLAVWPLLSILASIVLGLICGLIISFCFRFFASRANRMIMCIIAIFICVGISTLPWSTFLPEGVNFSTSGLLSTMICGATLINFGKQSDMTFERIDLITPPIFMLFFVISGASLDLSIFASKNAVIIIAIALVYLIFRVIGKWLGAFSSTTITKCDKNVRTYLGFALIPQAGVAIGLATSATTALTKEGQDLIELGQTEAGQQLVNYGSMILAIILTSTLIYELIGPVITKLVLTKAGEIKRN